MILSVSTGLRQITDLICPRNGIITLAVVVAAVAVKLLLPFLVTWIPPFVFLRVWSTAKDNCLLVDAYWSSSVSREGRRGPLRSVYSVDIAVRCRRFKRTIRGCPGRSMTCRRRVILLGLRWKATEEAGEAGHRGKLRHSN